MDLLQNRRFLSCKMSYHIRRTTCARLARRFPLHNKFINPHLLCLGFLFQLSLLKHQSERYHEKDARTPYRPDSELRHGKRTKSSTECEQRDDAKVTFRAEPRPPTAAGQGTAAPFCERTEVPDAHRAGVDIAMYLAKRLHLHRACKRNDGVGREVETGRDETISSSVSESFANPSRRYRFILLACHIVRGSMCRTFTVPHPHRANKVVGDHSGEERG